MAAAISSKSSGGKLIAFASATSSSIVIPGGRVSSSVFRSMVSASSSCGSLGVCFMACASQAEWLIILFYSQLVVKHQQRSVLLENGEIPDFRTGKFGFMPPIKPDAILDTLALFVCLAFRRFTRIRHIFDGFPG